MKEIGSFRELDLRMGYEYYTGEMVARLNSGRSGIYHALKCLNCNKIKIPYYECETVKNFLIKKNVKISYYHIDRNLRPLLNEACDADEAILIVNYFAALSTEELQQYALRFNNLIVDNTQAFFQKPILKAYSVYSPRKFFGVPDGAYVIGENVRKKIEEYQEDLSSDTSSFLLTRIETGSNRNFSFYKENEKRIDDSDILRMSILTRKLLDNIDYEDCKSKRKKNFEYARKKFEAFNLLNMTLFDNLEESYPMAYPLLIENRSAREIYKANGIFVGQWWKYLVDNPQSGENEEYFSRYLLPIPIDQRYSESELNYIYEITKKITEEKLV